MPGLKFSIKTSDFRIRSLAICLPSSDFRFSLGSEVEFDIYNATFNTCVSHPGEGGPITFSNKTWVYPEWFPTWDHDLSIEENLSNPDRYNYDLMNQAVISYAWVRELVAESPGPEVIANIRCRQESGSNEQVQIFAGNVPEARQLGRTLPGQVNRLGNYENFWIRQHEYPENDDSMTYHEAYTDSSFYWLDNDWHESRPERWILEKKEIPPRSTYPIVWETSAFYSESLSDLETLELVAFDPFSIEQNGEWVEVSTEEGVIKEFQGMCVSIIDFLVVEIVSESPGPEVLVGTDTNGCGTMRGFSVEMFAGHSSDPIRIGDSLSEVLFGVDEDGGVLTGVTSYSDGAWINCCPDSWIVSKNYWLNGKWEEAWTEEWRIEEKFSEPVRYKVEAEVIDLVERVGIRGTKAIAPDGWAYTYTDGGGSGSWSYWKNPRNSVEEVGLVTGASFGTWLGIDGVEGSVDPTQNLISKWGDAVKIEKVNDRTFNFNLNLTDETFNYSHVSTEGVWIASLSDDGSCCVAFTEAWITLEEPTIDKEIVEKFRTYIISNLG